MPSYVIFDSARRDLHLRCAPCGKVVVLSTSSELTSGGIRPDPALAIRQHYRHGHLAKAGCEKWFGEPQDFYVKDLARKVPTRKFSWPDPDEEEDYEYYIRCTLCGAEEGYSGTTEVGLKGMCEICNHPFFQHDIIVSALYAEPSTGEFEIPRFK